MRLSNKIAILGSAGALMALLALAPARATEQKQQSNGLNQPAHTTILRVTGKVQKDIIKDRVHGIQLREMRDRAESEDGAASPSAEPRLSTAEEDATR